MLLDDDEEKLLRSVALQNARAIHNAREQAERALIAAKEALELKSAELAEQREFFRVTLASIGDGVVTTDTDARVTFLNPVAERMTGWSLQDSLGQPLDQVFKILHELTREPVASPVLKVLRERKLAALANHAVLIARDGTETPIEDSAAPIFDGNGKMFGVVMVFHEVTERRRKEAELRDSHLLLIQARDQLEKRVAERTADLEAANDSLRELSARILQIQDEEQRRLARELHDSVGQLIAAIGMNVGVVQREAHKLSPAAARCVAENADLVQEANREIRTISHLLHPPLLDEIGLLSALRWYTEGFAERSRIKVDLEIPEDLGRPSTNVEMAVFRIIQECLTNVHRHSGSATAAVRISRSDGNITVQVADAGRGITRERQAELAQSGRTGVGFRGMRERIRQFGGNLTIESEGKGTIVTAVLPAG